MSKPQENSSKEPKNSTQESQEGVTAVYLKDIFGDSLTETEMVPLDTQNMIVTFKPKK